MYFYKLRQTGLICTTYGGLLWSNDMRARLSPNVWKETCGISGMRACAARPATFLNAFCRKNSTRNAARLHKCFHSCSVFINILSCALEKALILNVDADIATKTFEIIVHGVHEIFKTIRPFKNFNPCWLKSYARVFRESQTTLIEHP